MEYEFTKKELATISGYTYRRLFDIDRDLPNDKKLFVPTESGKYDLCVFVQRWVAYNVNENFHEEMTLEDAKTAHEQVKIKKTELEVERMRGVLVDVNEVRRLWATVANTVVQNMIRLPSKIAGQVYGLDNVEMIAGIIEKEVRDVLTNIAETPLPAEAIRSESEEDDEDEEED